MKKIKLLIALSLSLAFNAAYAAPVVIVNPKNPNKVSTQDVKDIYSGKSKSFADGSSAVPLISKNEKTREGFLAVLGKSESQYKSAWSSLIFTGKAQPPKEIDTEEEIVKLIATNPNMIGVVDSSKADSSVKEVK